MLVVCQQIFVTTQPVVTQRCIESNPFLLNSVSFQHAMCPNIGSLSTYSFLMAWNRI